MRTSNSTFLTLSSEGQLRGNRTCFLAMEHVVPTLEFHGRSKSSGLSSGALQDVLADLTWASELGHSQAGDWSTLQHLSYLNPRVSNFYTSPQGVCKGQAMNLEQTDPGRGHDLARQKQPRGPGVWSSWGCNGHCEHAQEYAVLSVQRNSLAESTEWMNSQPIYEVLLKDKVVKFEDLLPCGYSSIPAILPKSLCCQGWKALMRKNPFLKTKEINLCDHQCLQICHNSNKNHTGSCAGNRPDYDGGNLIQDKEYVVVDVKFAVESMHLGPH
eukprot:bmy_18247T0